MGKDLKIDNDMDYEIIKMIKDLKLFIVKKIKNIRNIFTLNFPNV